MDPSWAAQNLQLIRTLMERAAVYRRALAPIMFALGSLAALAALAAFFLPIQSPTAFVLYWILLAFAALATAFLLARRQALKDQEPFWSPPTRRIAQALLPLLCTGGLLGLFSLYPQPGHPLLIWWLTVLWMMLYGCALHSAGFFMQRGIKWLGWLFLLTGAALGLLLTSSDAAWPLRYAHGAMAVAFGGWHLAYGFYLHFTENRDARP